MKIVIAIVVWITIGEAAPAYIGDIEFQQKDGTTFIGNLKGDEWFSWIEDKNNNIIKYNNQSKNYEYGLLKDINGSLELVPSGSKVIDNDLNSTSPSSSSSSPSIIQNSLSEIWKRKRQEAMQYTK